MLENSVTSRERVDQPDQTVSVEQIATIRQLAGRAARDLRYAALHDVATTHFAAGPSDADAQRLRRLPLTAWERAVFSQFGEDGVIAEVLRRIRTRSNWFVEFGAEAGIEGNTVFLAQVLGWDGLLIESDREAARSLAWRHSSLDAVRTAHATVTAENIEALLGEHGVPTEFDVLSIDIDGIDWWVWRAIVSHRPAVVVIEFNGHLAIDRSITVPLTHREPWDGTAYYGASLTAFERLGRAKGYRLVHTELNGNNAFFVREDLCSAMPGDDVVARRMTNLYLAGIVHPPDPHARPWVQVDERGEPV